VKIGGSCAAVTGYKFPASQSSLREGEGGNKVRCQESEYSTDVALIRVLSSAFATLRRGRLLSRREKPSSQKKKNERGRQQPTGLSQKDEKDLLWPKKNAFCLWF
jgi:hypothetical protein